MGACSAGSSVVAFFVAWSGSCLVGVIVTGACEALLARVRKKTCTKDGLRSDQCQSGCPSAKPSGGSEQLEQCHFLGYLDHCHKCKAIFWDTWVIVISVKPFSGILGSLS